MGSNHVLGIEEVLSLFNDLLDPSDVLHSKLMSQISSAIIKERLKLHMTQAQFAEHIDVNQSLISRWECGTYNFSLKKLAQIAVKLNLDVNIDCRPMLDNKTSDMFSETFSNTKIIRYSSTKKELSKSHKSCVSSFVLPNKMITNSEVGKYVAIR